MLSEFMHPKAQHPLLLVAAVIDQVVPIRHTVGFIVPTGGPNQTHPSLMDTASPRLVVLQSLKVAD